MLVRFLGFSLESKPFSDLVGTLEMLSSSGYKSIQADNVGRYLFVKRDLEGQYYFGLIVTVKNQRKFCELIESGASFKVAVSSLAENSKLMDFNFFLVNASNGMGLYQHYHQSCSISQAMYLIRNGYKGFIEAKREVLEKQLLGEGADSDAAKRLSRKRIKYTFRWDILVRKENLEKILSELDKIKSLEINFASLVPDQREFRQLSGYVRKQKRKFTFFGTKDLMGLVSAITSVVQDDLVQDGRVYGVDSSGIDRVIRIQDNPDNFGEYEYDDVVSKIHDLDVDVFENSWIAQRLLEAVKDFSHIFGARVS